MNLAEQQLEFRIAEQALILRAHPDRLVRANAFKRLQELHKQRSVEVVREMEREKGIART